MSVKLSFKLPEGRDLNLEVEKERFTIGRSNKCDVVIPHEGLSREHCMVEMVGDDVFVTDLGSANGVLIDDQKIIPHEKHKFNFTLASLSLGNIELTKFLVMTPDEILHIDHGTSAETSNPAIQVKKSSARSAGPKKEKEAKTDGPGIQLHPGVQGMLIMLILAIGYFFYNQFMGGDTSESDNISQMMYENAMKNKANDGSIKTRNF